MKANYPFQDHGIPNNFTIIGVEHINKRKNIKSIFESPMVCIEGQVPSQYVKLKITSQPGQQIYSEIIFYTTTNEIAVNEKLKEIRHETNAYRSRGDSND